MKQLKKTLESEEKSNIGKRPLRYDHGNKFCSHCSRTIDPKDKWVLLGTYKGETTMEEVYFHFACYEAHFRESVEKKVGSMMNMVTKQFGQTVKQYKEVYG